jgi:hypothetical protein
MVFLLELYFSHLDRSTRDINIEFTIQTLLKLLRLRRLRFFLRTDIPFEQAIKFKPDCQPILDLAIGIELEGRKK